MNVKLAALLSVVIALTACAPAASLGGDVGLARADVARASADPADAVQAGTAVDAFGLDLYRAMAAGQTNLVFSPASITLALAMARAGARGVTASEMDAVMHGAAADDHAGWLNALDQALATRSGTFQDESGKDVPITLRIANAPFAQQGMPLEKTYLEALAGRFGGGLRLVDYESQTEQARRADQWLGRRPDGAPHPGAARSRRAHAGNPPYARQRDLPQGALGDAVPGRRDDGRHVHARRRLDRAGAVHGHHGIPPRTRPGAAGARSRSHMSADRWR